MCSACSGVFHPSTGQYLAENTRLCGPCCRDFTRWLKSHTARKWGGQKFYRHAETSIVVRPAGWTPSSSF